MQSRNAELIRKHAAPGRIGGDADTIDAATDHGEIVDFSDRGRRHGKAL